MLVLLKHKQYSNPIAEFKSYCFTLNSSSVSKFLKEIESDSTYVYETQRWWKEMGRSAVSASILFFGLEWVPLTVAGGIKVPEAYPQLSIFLLLFRVWPRTRWLRSTIVWYPQFQGNDQGANQKLLNSDFCLHRKFFSWGCKSTGHQKVGKVIEHLPN